MANLEAEVVPSSAINVRKPHGAEKYG